jgi:protein-S-isoprenylcysteine O-methyltransferase Ste14
MKYSAILWALWFLYWLISARSRVHDTADSTVQREPFTTRLKYSSLIWIGFLLLFWHGPLPFDRRLWPANFTSLALGLAIQALGLGFTVWARLILGSNWSGRIATGGNQQLVTAGPYQFIRHPIYSGFLFAIAGMTVVVGSVRGLLGFAFVVTGIVVKIRHEEASVRRHFGSLYEDYARRVPALVPRWPNVRG